MEETKNAFLEAKHFCKQTLVGRHGRRCNVNIMMNFREKVCEDVECVRLPHEIVK
jgi:hypothetical protein